MPHFVELIQADQVPVGVSVRVHSGGEYYVVCKDGGRYYVADCVCPHAGGPLANADVRDGCVICPVHYWPWSLETGLTDENMPDLKLAVYPCEVRDGAVWADFSSRTTRSSPDLDCHSHE